MRTVARQAGMDWDWIRVIGRKLVDRVGQSKLLTCEDLESYWRLTLFGRRSFS